MNDGSVSSILAAPEEEANGTDLPALGEAAWLLGPPKLNVGGEALGAGFAAAKSGGGGLSAFDSSPSGLLVGIDAPNPKEGADGLLSLFGAAKAPMGFSYSLEESASGLNWRVDGFSYVALAKVPPAAGLESLECEAIKEAGDRFSASASDLAGVARWIPLNPWRDEVGAAALLRLEDKLSGLGSGDAVDASASEPALAPARRSSVCMILLAVSVVTADAAGSLPVVVPPPDVCLAAGGTGVALGAGYGTGAGGGMLPGAGPESRGIVARPRSLSYASNSAKSRLRFEPAESNPVSDPCPLQPIPAPLPVGGDPPPPEP